MDALSLLAGAVAGVLVGGVLAWLLAGRREHDARVRAEAQVAAMATQQTLLETAERRLTDTFQAAAQQALHGNSQLFLQLAEQSLGQKETAIQGLVKPLQESLKQYEEHLTTLERHRQADQSTLAEQLRALAQANEKLQLETGNLVTALRSPAVRGRWGELALRRVAELAGMIEHCDFDEQTTVTGDDGGRRRPDMTVHLPAGRTLVVDSKVSADAYLTAVAAATEAERRTALEAHARQLRQHVQALSAKAYWEQFQTSPDFVVMFVAVEPSIGPAMSLDARLFEEALEKRVIIATPSFLIALLLTVAHAWRQERVAQNAEEVSRLGKDLHDRISRFAGHLTDMGAGLQRALRGYNAAVGSLEHSVLPQARRFKELGVSSTRTIGALDPITDTPRQPVSADTNAGLPHPVTPAEALAEPLPPLVEAAPAEPPRRRRINLNPDDAYGD